jgi:HK97 family phage prohead protease
MTITDAMPQTPVEFRTVTDLEVRWPDRVISLVAVPYDTDGVVIVHGRMCVESHAPGAYDGVERRANRVKVNRDHDYHRTVGRAVALHPSRTEGLVTELRIARTPLGDETLALAEDESLEASVGFQVMPHGETWTEGRSRRRVTKAYLDHIALVPEGAYEGRVLSVRMGPTILTDSVAAPVDTPNLDEVLAWMRLTGR